MATVGTLKSPTAAVNVNLFSNAWSNVTNVYASDNSRASCTFIAATSSDYIYITGFGFTIPDDSDIVGIKVEIEGSSTQGAAYVGARLLKASVLAGDQKTYPESSSEAYVTLGDSGSLWNTTFNYADINNSGFGVAVRMFGTGSTGTGYIDHVRVTVYHLCADMTITTTTLADGYENEAYSQTIVASATATFTSTGTLPTGLTLSSAGVLSGTPTTDGSYNFTVTATTSCGVTDTQDYTVVIYNVTAKTLTDSVSSVTETISNTTASYSIPHAYNNEAYVMNTITGTFSYIDNLPFSSVIYRPDLMQLLGTRRDLGNLSVLNSGGTFDGTAIDWHIKSGYYDLGSIDEVKKMEAHMAEAIKRLRVMYLEAKSADGFTLTIRTENDSTGIEFAVEPQVQDNVTVNLVRIALSRDIRGKYIQFELAGSCDAWIGQMKVGIKARGLK